MISLLLVLLLADAPKIQEKYSCIGTSPDGNYKLSLTIEAKGENYFLTWADGAMVGMGFRKDDSLVVAFVNRTNGGVGVVIYEIKESQLLGSWSGGAGSVYRESCSVGTASLNALR